MTEIALSTTVSKKVTIAYLSAALITPLLSQEFVLVIVVLILVSAADFIVALLRTLKTGDIIKSSKLANKAISLGAYLIGLLTLQLLFSPITSNVTGLTGEVILNTPIALAGALILREVLSILEHINSIRPLPIGIFKNINKK